MAPAQKASRARPSRDCWGRGEELVVPGPDQSARQRAGAGRSGGRGSPGSRRPSDPEGQRHRGCRPGFALCRCSRLPPALTPGHVKLLGVATETPAAMIGFSGYVQDKQAAGGNDLGRGGSERCTGSARLQGRRTATGPSPTRWRGRNACSRPAPPMLRRSRPCMRTSGDREGLAASCKIARRDGFVGRIAIHPDQVATINSCFTPSETDIDHARRVVAAFAASPTVGTVGIDGKMYDRPHRVAARRSLASIGEAVSDE